MKSTVTVSKMVNGMFSIKASGAFGGGWTMPVKPEAVASAVIRAYQMYGTNKEGILFVAVEETPEDAKRIISQLQSVESGNPDSILTRMSAVETSLVRQAAESSGKSINQWCREKLVEATNG